MGLSLQKTEVESVYVCVMIRKKMISPEQTKKIIEQISGSNAEIRKFDTVLNTEKSITGAYRESLVISKLKEFAECETVVTDRLHGMIFSYITSTPCLAVSNSTGKSLYAYNDWLNGSRGITFCIIQMTALQSHKMRRQ